MTDLDKVKNLILIFENFIYISHIKIVQTSETSKIQDLYYKYKIRKKLRDFNDIC